MELELLEGIFHRIGKIYTEKSSGSSSVPMRSKESLRGKDDRHRKEFIEGREKYLEERSNQLKHKSIRKLRGDSGYSSMIQSGHSSIQASKSPSPVPPDQHPRPRVDTRERKWLVCQTGVVAVRLVHQGVASRVEDTSRSASITPEDTAGPQKDENTIEVEIEDTGDVINVDARFLEEAGPASQNTTADLSELQVVTESQVLASVCSRFSQGDYQTRLGTSLVSVNPMRRTDSGCGRTSRSRRSGGSGCEPLLNRVEEIYRKAILTEQTQSLVMMGRSGSGKSCNFKQSLAYLIETTQPPPESRFTLEKMHAMDCLLESFCSTRTSLNTHATRLVQLMELQFDRQGYLAGGSVEMALPDTNRLLRIGRLSGEPTFPILYQVQAALGKSNLFLPPRMLSKNSFFTPLQEDVEIMTALEDWGRVCEAMELLEMVQEEQDSFWIILAAITNLGYIAKCLETGEALDPASLAKIAKLLGVKSDDLKQVFSRPNTPRTISPASSLATSSTSSRTSSPAPPASPLGYRGICTSMPDLTGQAADNVRRLAVNLYAELLSRLVGYINRSIRPSTVQPSNIFIFDSPGFQNPATTGEKPSAGFVELCYNYLQEKLQDIFNSEKIDKISQGKAALKVLFAKRGNAKPILNLLERQGQKGSKRTRTLGRRESKRVRFQNTAPGLFTLLHRAANCPWSDDEVFLQRLIAHWGSSCNGGLVERVEEDKFMLRHSLGTNPVRYSVRGWRQLSYSMGRTNLALELLRKSSREELVVNSPSLVYHGIGMNQTPLTLSDVKARMSCLQVQVQVETVVQLLARTEISFVFCLLPHNLAGLCELFKKSPGRHSNQKLIRDQLRGYQIVDYLNALKCTSCSRESELTDRLLDSEACICKVKESSERSGLAGELWHGLQLAVLNAITNLDSVETALTSLTRTVSLPAHPISQALDETGLLLLEGGSVSLNLKGILD